MTESTDTPATIPFTGCIETVDELARYIELTPDEAAAIE